MADRLMPTAPPQIKWSALMATVVIIAVMLAAFVAIGWAMP